MGFNDFRPHIKVVRPKIGVSDSLRSLLILNVLAVIVGAFGLFMSIYFLAARLIDDVPYSALEILLPVGAGTIVCLVLQGIAVWRVAK